MEDMKGSHHFKGWVVDAATCQGKIRLKINSLPKEESSHKRLKHKVYIFSNMWWRIIMFLFKIIEYGVSWLRKLSEISTRH